MDDERLDAMLKVAAEEWRTAPLAEPEALWERIEEEAYRRPQRAAGPGWRVAGLGIAAALLIGVALGRLVLPAAAPAPVTAAAPVDSLILPVADGPYLRTTNELLGRTALLLAALPEAGIAPGPSFMIARQGGELLTTTRLLLDSPVGVDPQMRALLEDLELVLAQVARLQAPGSGDLLLIHDAVDRREIVPRLRSAVISASIQLN